MRTDPQTKGLKFVYVTNIQQQQVRGVACAHLFSQFFRLDSPERLGAFVACCSEAELFLYLSHVGPCVRLGLDVGVSVFHTLLCQMNARVLTRETSLEKNLPAVCKQLPAVCKQVTWDLSACEKRKRRRDRATPGQTPSWLAATLSRQMMNSDATEVHIAEQRTHHTVWGISNTYAQFRSDGSSSFLLSTQTTTMDLCMLGCKAPCPMTK